MKNVHFIHLHGLYPVNSGLDVSQWLCRTCAAKRHARPHMSISVNGTEVCEQCGAKQISFPIGAWVERTRVSRGTRTRVGRIVGVRSGRLVVDWIESNRIGGDGWRRDYIAFTGVKPASDELQSKAERYANRVESRP